MEFTCQVARGIRSARMVLNSDLKISGLDFKRYRQPSLRAMNKNGLRSAPIG
jgi:hypothetical protein